MRMRNKDGTIKVKVKVNVNGKPDDGWRHVTGPNYQFLIPNLFPSPSQFVIYNL